MDSYLHSSTAPACADTYSEPRKLQSSQQRFIFCAEYDAGGAYLQRIDAAAKQAAASALQVPPGSARQLCAVNSVSKHNPHSNVCSSHPAWLVLPEAFLMLT